MKAGNAGGNRSDRIHGEIRSLRCVSGFRPKIDTNNAPAMKGCYSALRSSVKPLMK